MGSQQTTQPAWIEVSDYSHPAGWADAARAAERARQCCEQLERGEILLLRGIPFEFPQSDLDHLARHQAEDSRFHKNISYRPTEDLLRGFGGDAQSEQRVHAIMRNYSRAVTEFVARLLAPYAGRWTLAYASFMLHFHNWMKENSEFQAKAPRQRIEFPPFTTWLVFTDTVPHAVLSGQFALEQTCIVAVEAMVTPDVAPIRVLEKISGAK